MVMVPGIEILVVEIKISKKGREKFRNFSLKKGWNSPQSFNPLLSLVSYEYA
jgi:hypothetical protein